MNNKPKQLSLCDRCEHCKPFKFYKNDYYCNKLTGAYLNKMKCSDFKEKEKMKNKYLGYN